MSWDNAGRVVHKVETVAGTSHTYDYSYDPNGQLVGVARDGVTVESYSYDTNTNRLGATNGGVSATAAYDAQDRLTSIGATSYGFSTDGYLSSRGSDTFTYSARGELLSATVGGQSVSYGYDGFGRQVSRTAAAGTTQFLYGNPDNPYQLTAERDPAGTLTTYIYDEGSRLVALDRGGTRFYVASDQLGTPRVVSDATGNAVKVVDRDSFGRQTADSNPSFALSVGYAGGLSDPTTGLVRMGARDYDPTTGRWTSRDQSVFQGHQANLYAYVANSPINFRDSSGLFSISGSAYSGVGVGGALGIDFTGISFCGEVGLGIGVGASVDPFGGIDRAGTIIEADASVSVGPASVGVSVQLDNCGSLSGAVQACAGPLCAQVGADDEGLHGGVSITDGILAGIKKAFKGTGVKAEAKIAAKKCWQYKW